MGDLISREALLEEIKCYQMDIVSKATAMRVIRNAPAVTDTNVGGKWIPCSERLPVVEQEVFILAKRKFKGGKVIYITTIAMYEDGTMLENDSCWRWEDIGGEWNEEEDCYIIPEGWWESKKYNPDGECNYAVDDEVLAWMPLPKPYQQT